jgi:NAD(P)-dependent dehydrogenase (short-subunit alcohol dehydrogenase family)
MTRFEGKIAAVTGGASGIGFAVAERLVTDGATVAILDLAGADSAAKELGGTGYVVDVSDAAQVETTLQAVVARYGGLHLLVNNAGIDGGPFPLAQYPPDEFDRVIAVNLRGVFLGMRYGIPHILASGGGAIVNTASAAGIRGVPSLAPYSATKAAVISLTKTAAVEYADQGVRINAVLPGAIETPMMAKIFDEAPEMRDPIVAGHPLGRTGTPAEIAATVAFLLSDDAGFITGAGFSADGGYTAA